MTVRPKATPAKRGDLLRSRDERACVTGARVARGGAIRTASDGEPSGGWLAGLSERLTGGDLKTGLPATSGFHTELHFVQRSTRPNVRLSSLSSPPQREQVISVWSTQNLLQRTRPVILAEEGQWESRLAIGDRLLDLSAKGCVCPVAASERTDDNVVRSLRNVWVALASTI